MSGRRKGKKTVPCGKRIDYAALNAKEEYEDLRQRANSDLIRKSLAGRMTPSRRAIVDKLNKCRKEKEEKKWNI